MPLTTGVWHGQCVAGRTGARMAASLLATLCTRGLSSSPCSRPKQSNWLNWPRPSQGLPGSTRTIGLATLPQGHPTAARARGPIRARLSTRRPLHRGSGPNPNGCLEGCRLTFSSCPSSTTASPFLFSFVFWPNGATPASFDPSTGLKPGATALFSFRNSAAGLSGYLSELSKC